jgi:hypothetical protein
MLSSIGSLRSHDSCAKSLMFILRTQQRLFSSSASVSSGKNELIVIGGNGFLGSSVCRRALDSGLSVTSVNRSGLPKQRKNEAWVHKVNWVAADALNVDRLVTPLTMISSYSCSCSSLFFFLPPPLPILTLFFLSIFSSLLLLLP